MWETRDVYYGNVTAISCLYLGHKSPVLETTQCSIVEEL